jgi:hypothetical protein
VVFDLLRFTSMALVNKVKRTGIRDDALEHLCNEAPVLTLRASIEFLKLPGLYNDIS